MRTDITIILAPTYELALTRTPEATVEAEYGSRVREGALMTLAHHVEAYRHHPSPCNAKVSPLPKGASEILISHIDLDTIGGIMALCGRKPVNTPFWETAEYIDLNGPHRIHEVPVEPKEQIEAYWAWADQQTTAFQTDNVTDVTSLCDQHFGVIERILNGDSALIEQGKVWASERMAKAEACLVEEDERVRVFVTSDVFTMAQYYSPALESFASVTVSYHTQRGSITVATSDGSIDCCHVMQELFGPEAGGHKGIAGSPRNTRMSLKDFLLAVETVKSLVIP